MLTTILHPTTPPTPRRGGLEADSIMQNSVATVYIPLPQHRHNSQPAVVERASSQSPQHDVAGGNVVGEKHSLSTTVECLESDLGTASAPVDATLGMFSEALAAENSGTSLQPVVSSPPGSGANSRTEVSLSRARPRSGQPRTRRATSTTVTRLVTRSTSNVREKRSKSKMGVRRRNPLDASSIGRAKTPETSSRGLGPSQTQLPDFA